MKKSMYLFTTTLVISLIVGCATYKPFIGPGFTGVSLTDGGLAVFPVMVGEGSRSVPGVEKYCRTAGEEMATSLRKAQPALKVVGPTQVSATLANEDLVEDFSKMKQTYAITGMLDVKKAKKITDPLNVQYIMLVSITSLYASGDSKAVAEMGVKIWDSSEGQMVFEAVRSGKDASIFSGPPYEGAIKEATQNLTDTLVRIYQQK